MYTEQELISIAQRENNRKRGYLVINKRQGKHIPVSPTEAFAMFDALAETLAGSYPEETLLLVGFAETATAIGARLAVRLNSYYIQTTRETLKGVSYLFFTEAHSHAAEQRLVAEDVEEAVSKADRIVFVEDEVTTGNTILNIISILKEKYPDKTAFSVASLINGMSGEDLLRYERQGIRLHYLLKTNHKAYEEQAMACHGEENSHAPDVRTVKVRCFFMDSYVDARRLTTGSAYAKACAKLWEQVQKKLVFKAGETILVIGTEEFMYPALFVGECLERRGHSVKCHSTTRSPIMAYRGGTYLPRSRYELISVYEEERKTFLYELSRYDRVFILTDAAQGETKGEYSLINALKACGNEKIQLIRWCEK